MADLSDRAARARSGGTVRMWSSGEGKRRDNGQGDDGGFSPPATPVRSPFHSHGSSGLLRTQSDLGGDAAAAPPATAEAAVRAAPSPAAAQRTPPRTAPAPTQRVSRPQSLMTPERSTEQPRVARPTVEQVQILTLKHSADDAGAEPPAPRGPPMAVERAAPGARAAPAVVCGAPMRALQQGADAAPIRRTRPSGAANRIARSRSASSLELSGGSKLPTTSARPAAAEAPEAWGASQAAAGGTPVHVRQAPLVSTRVSPQARVVHGAPPMEDTEESWEYVPPKYGTPEWVDMAELQGKSRREAEFGRRQRLAQRDERLDRFEEERQGFVAEINERMEAAVAAARQRQEHLHRKWERQVFGRIQEQVLAKVDAIDDRDMERRLRMQSEEFCAQVDRNGGRVYLEPSSLEERQTIDAAQAAAVRYSSRGMVDPLKDEQNRLAEERRQEAELAQQVNTGRWSLENFLGGRVEGPPRWDRGVTPLHEMPAPATAAQRAARRQRSGEDVRLAAHSNARDAHRLPPGDYVGAAPEMIARASRDPSRPVGRQQKTTDPILPNHYNSGLRSADTHRREHIAVNGRGKKLGPFGPTGGFPS